MKISIHYKGVFFDVPKEIFYSYFDGSINWYNLEFGESVFDRNGRAMFTLNSYEVDKIELAQWLTKSRDIQWDYANIVKRK